MDIGAIFLLLAVIFIAGLLVASPFPENRRMAVVSAEEQELSALMAERDRLITALQEIDFDPRRSQGPGPTSPVDDGNAARCLALRQRKQRCGRLETIVNADAVSVRRGARPRQQRK